MDDDVAGCLMLIGGIFAFVAALVVLVVAAFVAWHWLLAFVILGLARSYPVRKIVLTHGWERHAIRVWLWYLPVVAAGVWVLGMLQLAMVYEFSDLLTAVVVISGTILLLHFYYDHYVARMPKSADWNHFVAAAKHMELERRLTFIEQSTKMRVWWLGLWS